MMRSGVVDVVGNRVVVDNPTVLIKAYVDIMIGTTDSAIIITATIKKRCIYWVVSACDNIYCFW